MNPLEALQSAVTTGLLPRGSSILLAVSGGADSTALLYAAAAAAPENGWKLAVGHVHHGWRGRDADRDLAFVSDHARRLGLPFLVRRRNARSEARRWKLSPEAAARRVRYGALAEMACEAKTTLIATAHQRDDRVETLFLALERGAGLAGLAGPRSKRADGVVRPFLCVSRSDVLAFLRYRGIAFRRDATNGDLALPRNRIRRSLARLASERGAQALEPLARQIEHLDSRREDVDREFERTIRPSLSMAPGSVVADARLLASCPPSVARRALEEVARPFAAPGRPPLTGPEREQILRRLRTGKNFRFEAGRRIRLERRGPLLTARATREAFHSAGPDREAADDPERAGSPEPYYHGGNSGQRS